MTNGPIRVDRVDTFPCTFGTDREQMSFLFVRVTADDGSAGWGEVCDSYGCSYAGVLAHLIDEVLAPLVVGQELTSVDLVADRMRLFTRRRLGDAWVAPQARSGVEIALRDLSGQAASRSISHELGRTAERVEVYASCGFLEEGPAEHHLQVIGPLLDRGVRKVKVRTGPDWRSDLETLRTLASTVGTDVEWMVDASETYTLPTARALAAALTEFDAQWIEEPLPQCERAGIESLVAASPVPVAYGEHMFGLEEALDALRRRQLDVLQPDAATAGGIGEARKMAMAAPAFGVRVVPHICAGPVAVAANLHLAASVPAIRLVEYPPSLIPVWETFGTGPGFGPDAIEDGHLRVPDTPGLGVGIDPAAVAAHPYEPPGARVAGTTTGLPDRFVGDR
jgi:D-galactarolactone cycloisomerase